MSIRATIRVQRKEVKPGWFQRAMGIFKQKQLIVKVGFPNGSSSADNIQKAIWNEFGTKGGRSGGGWGGPVPERPFMRTTVYANRGKYRDAMRVSAPKILNGETTLDIVLRKLGEVVKSDIQTKIASGVPPPNSPLTIQLKGSSKPLIDTGAMRAAVTYVVEKK